MCFRKMEEFLKSQNIPEHISKLLELYGVCTIEDLLELTDDDLMLLEKTVREGGFKAQVDWGHFVRGDRYQRYDQ